MFYKKILHDFQNQLNQIETNNLPNYLELANSAIILCQNTLLSLKNKLLSNDFENNAQEIDFFKHGKTEPMKYLIYFLEMRLCEVRIQMISKKYQSKFLNKKIQRVNQFFCRNEEFLLYMNLRYTHHDRQYFTREFQNTFCFTNPYSYLTDPLFTTSHDILWAKIKGFCLYAEYLQKKITKLTSSKPDLGTNISKQYFLEWTSSKAAAVELIYAVHSSNLINRKYGIKDIAKTFEQTFNIDLGDYYHTFSEIRSRKINRTKLIDTLKENLIRKMDENDE